MPVPRLNPKAQEEALIRKQRELDREAQAKRAELVKSEDKRKRRPRGQDVQAQMCKNGAIGEPPA